MPTRRSLCFIIKSSGFFPVRNFKEPISFQHVTKSDACFTKPKAPTNCVITKKSLTFVSSKGEREGMQGMWTGSNSYL